MDTERRFSEERNGREVHDRARLPSVDEPAGDELETAETTEHVDVVDGEPVVVGHVEQGHPREDPGVVHEQVDAAERIAGSDHRRTVAPGGDVTTDRHRSTSSLLDRSDEPLGSTDVVEVVDDDRSASGCHRLDHRRPDPLLRAGDERDTAVERSSTADLPHRPWPSFE